MPDITMCEGTDCPLRDNCYRYTATPTPERQSYFVAVPYSLHRDECLDYHPRRVTINCQNEDD